MALTTLMPSLGKEQEATLVWNNLDFPRKSSRVMVVRLCWLPRKYPPQLPKWAVLLNETTLTRMLIRNRIDNPVEVWVLSICCYKAGDFTELENLVTPLDSFARVLGNKFLAHELSLRHNYR